MKKLLFTILIGLSILIPRNVFASMKTTTPCDEVKRDEQMKQIKTCYIDIEISGDTTFYGVNGELKFYNTSMKGNIEAVDQRIKITDDNLANLIFTTNTKITNETIRIAKFTVYLAPDGTECKVSWMPKEYEINYSCIIKNNYFYDKNGNVVSEEEYNKQCKPHYCEIIDGTYFDKSGNATTETEYNKQCKPVEPKYYTCEIISGVYYDKTGNIVTNEEYDKQCNAHYCKVLDGTYFGKNGDIISKLDYDVQCPSNNPHTQEGLTLWYVLGGILTASLITIIVNIKKNKKVFKI